MDAIGQHSLHGELLLRLRKLVTTGELPQGSKIPERELCTRFGVSRTPLREAIKVLAAEGLVQLEPHRGAVVARMTLEELEEALPISAAIEALSGELACRHITDEEIAAIKALHDRMIAAHDAADWDTYLSLNRKIHESILEAARNPLLTSIYDAIFFRVGRTRVRPQLTPDVVARALADHNAIIEALERRQGARLSALLKRHVEALSDAYRKAWVSG